MIYRVIMLTLLLNMMLIAPVDAEQSPSEVLRMGKGTIHDIAWSADGRWMAVASSSGIWIYDSIQSDATPRHHATDMNVRRVVFSPEGDEIAGILQDFQLLRWNLNTNDITLTSVPHPENDFFRGGSAVAYSPDGRWLAYGYQEMVLLDRQTEQQHLIDCDLFLSDIAFSSDSQLVACFSTARGDADFGALMIWDIQSDSIYFRPAININGIKAGTFSSDTTMIYVWTWEDIFLAWDITHTEKNQPIENPPQPEPALLPDGHIYTLQGDKYAYYADHILYQVDVETREQRIISEDHHMTYTHLALSPDGQIIALYDGVYIHLWNIQSDYLGRSGIIDRTIIEMAFTSDGHLGALNQNGDVYIESLRDETITFVASPSPADYAHTRYDRLIAHEDQLQVIGCQSSEIASNTEFSPVGVSVQYSFIIECLNPRPWIAQINHEVIQIMVKDTLKISGLDNQIIHQIPINILDYPVNTLAVNHDATRITLAYGSGTHGGGSVNVGLLQWQFNQTASQFITLSTHDNSIGRANIIVYHPLDDSIFAVGSGGYGDPKRIQIWQVSDQSDEFQLRWLSRELSGDVIGLAFVPDGERLISASTNGLIHIWEINN